LNAVEIEEAVSSLAEQPFDPANFPYAFLEAFGNKPTTIQRLRSGSSNKSDVEGGVLQHNNIHIAVAPKNKVAEVLNKLRESPATKKQKAKFILSTDGSEFQYEDLTTNELPVICEYKSFPDHFGAFLPLAGISTVKQIRESSFDIRATSRLNRLYMQLLKDNPEWGTDQRRPDMNHFMARLIFCFFAEDTEIFIEVGLFTKTIQQMSASDSSNTHEIVSEIFRAMNTTWSARGRAQLPRWADFFPYVNGGLFSGSTEVPRFSKIARAYLLNIGMLDWKKINPDIFGSMIQAVAEDEERGALGMHYTSVSNIRRVLNPLFLDDLRSQLEKAGDNQRALFNLRKRISMIRVFDPACGSGNFLVIAYKDLREIESEINRRRNEGHLKSEISLTNFRGIEIRDFPSEVARLALIIAEYQCDVLYRGQKEALAEFLPLEADNWITCGNALRIDWLTVCPPIDEGETYICGNPPYRGSKWQTNEQKADLANAWKAHPKLAKTTDFISGWVARFLDYADSNPNAVAAFVSTNSLCQGLQASEVWPVVFGRGIEIRFAHTSFKWTNLASRNAAVMVIIVGLGKKSSISKKLFTEEVVKECVAIGPYLVANSSAVVQQTKEPISEQSKMLFGNMPRDNGSFILSNEQRAELNKSHPELSRFIRPYFGSEQMIQGKTRWCFWIEKDDYEFAKRHPVLSRVLSEVRDFRLASKAASTRDFAEKPYRFVQIAGTATTHSLGVAKVSSEHRPYLPVDLLNGKSIISDLLFALYDAPLWNMALIASRLHLVWIATVCGKMKTDFRYSNTLGWNTFPVPKLTEQNKSDLNRCAEDILLAREAHFPATIADLYDPDGMPEDLRRAHDYNDEVLERIYIGRRFRNDSERLEKLFALYEKRRSST